jgi:hypothetical protein
MDIDITFCVGKDCPLKKTCSRHMYLKDSFMEAYFSEAPYKKEEEKCEYYRPTETMEYEFVEQKQEDKESKTNSEDV